MTTPSLKHPYQNRLLASFSPAVIERLGPHLVPMTFTRGQGLHNAGQRIEEGYFLENGICSLVVTMENGSTVEVGITGREGFVGVPLVLGTDRSPSTAFIQVAGSGFSIKERPLRDLMSDTGGELRSSMLRAVQALHVQTAHTAACNRVHELDERLARWLLMCQDRVQSDHLLLTHEFLAVMLGSRRSSVTIAAGMLQKSGIIDYSRGHVRILDRKLLEDSACECYQIIHDEYVRLGLF